MKTVALIVLTAMLAFTLILLDLALVLGKAVAVFNLAVFASCIVAAMAALCFERK